MMQKRRMKCSPTENTETRKNAIAKRVAETKAGRPDLVRVFLDLYTGDRQDMRRRIEKYWRG